MKTCSCLACSVLPTVCVDVNLGPEVRVFVWGLRIWDDWVCQERARSTCLTDNYQFLNLQQVTDTICSGNKAHALVMTQLAETKGHSSEKLVVVLLGDVYSFVLVA